MVVLTPNDQFRNTAYRVGEHNLITICQEFQRAHKLLKKLRQGSKIPIKEELIKLEKVQEEELKEVPASQESGKATSEEDELNLALNEIDQEKKKEDTKEEEDLVAQEERKGGE